MPVNPKLNAPFPSCHLNSNLWSYVFTVDTYDQNSSFDLMAKRWASKLGGFNFETPKLLFNQTYLWALSFEIDDAQSPINGYVFGQTPNIKNPTLKCDITSHRSAQYLMAKVLFLPKNDFANALRKTNVIFGRFCWLKKWKLFVVFYTWWKLFFNHIRLNLWSMLLLVLYSLVNCELLGFFAWSVSNIAYWTPLSLCLLGS